MALSVNYDMGGGIVASGMYFLIAAHARDKLTGKISASLLGFASEGRRRAYQAAHEAKLAAERGMADIQQQIDACVPAQDATRDEVNAIEAQKRALEVSLTAAKLRVVQADQDIAANGPAVPLTAQVSGLEAAAMTRDDGSVDLTALYNWIKPRFLGCNDR